jgi:CheY-like chemotaxis protein
MPTRDNGPSKPVLPDAKSQFQDLLGRLTIEEPMEETEAAFSHLTVLLVERKSRGADIIRGIFAALGIREFLQVTSMKEAMSAPQCDLIIAGDALSEKDAIALSTWIQNSNQNSAIRQCVALRSRVSEAFARQAVLNGIEDIITKPISAAGFLSRVLCVLLRKRGYIKSAHYRGLDRRRTARYHGKPERRRRHH